MPFDIWTLFSGAFVAISLMSFACYHVYKMVQPNNVKPNVDKLDLIVLRTTRILGVFEAEDQAWFPNLKSTGKI